MLNIRPGKYIYSKRFLIILTSLIMFFVFIFFPAGTNAENPEIAGVEYGFSIATEEITDKTLIPMRQFTDRTDLRIDRFAEDYFIFHLEDRHMLIRSGEKEVRSEDEKYELEAAPIKVNDDILIPFKLAKIFLEDDDFAALEELFETDKKNDVEERRGMHLVLVPETRKVSRGDSFEVEVKLKNFTERTASFTFNTGQKFELELLDEGGSVVFKWSRGKMFTQAIERIELEAGEVVSWSARVNTSGLKSGIYSLEGWLTDQRKSLTAKPVEIEIK